MTDDAQPAPEFSRPVTPPKEGARMAVSERARKSERTALAERFGVLGVDSFAVTAKLSAQGGEVLLTGAVSASLTQRCVVSMEPTATRLEEQIERRFTPGGRMKESKNFDPEDEDSPELLTEEIDVGEIAAETAVLAIDPYPRADDAALEQRFAAPPGAKPLDDDAVKPFAGLEALKRKLEANGGGDH